MIRFDALSKRFGAVRAVESLSLELRAGEVMVLLGPNGSGKTTSLKAAAGLLRPSSGAVWIGTPPLPATDPRARRALSFLPQKVAFPDALTGGEVVEFYRRLRDGSRERAAQALKMVALNGATSRAVTTYSGGMLQRLGLAVAALPDVPVLLLDEPSAALDPDGLSAFHRLVDERRRAGRTILFTSHQLADAEQLADRVAVLVEGRLAALLTAGELRDRLAGRGVMRLRLRSCPPGLAERLAASAPGTRWNGAELEIPGAASTRAAALERVREAGAEVLGLTAEEGRIEVLYQELIGGRS